MWNNKDDKVYRMYQVVEETTGIILPKELRKNYITIRTEKNDYRNEHGSVTLIRMCPPFCFPVVTPLPASVPKGSS